MEVEELNALGMIWDKRGAQWECGYAAAERYFREHGNLEVPSGYTAADGMCLGTWISNQRGAYLGTKRGAAPLTAEQVRKLDAIGMVWEVHRSRKKENRGECAAPA